MGALFDLSFTKFVSPTIARIVYVLGAVAIAIAYITWVVTAFNDSAGYGLLTLLILGPIVSLLWLCFLRVFLESLIAMILTAQNTAQLVKLGGGSAPAGPSFPGQAPSGPQVGGYPSPAGQTPPAGTSPTPPPSTPPSAPPAPGTPPAS